MKILHASKIGFPCDRNVWYSVNGHAEEISTRSKRIFAVGTNLESLIVEWLRDDGWEVEYNAGSQNAELKLEIPVAGGVIIGHPDCFLSGNILVDIKTMNERSFLNWKRNGTEKDKPQYYEQVQIYAEAAIRAGISIERLGIVGMNKNTSEIHIDLFDYEPERVAELIARAERIFATAELPEINEDLAIWCCRYCGFSGICEHSIKQRAKIKNDSIVETDNPDVINAMKLLQEARELSKAGKELEDDAKAVLDKKIRQQGIKSVKNGDLILNLVEVSSNRFDSTAFKKANPELAQAYMKNSVSVRYDIKEAM